MKVNIIGFLGNLLSLKINCISKKGLKFYAKQLTKSFRTEQAVKLGLKRAWKCFLKTTQYSYSDLIIHFLLFKNNNSFIMLRAEAKFSFKNLEPIAYLKNFNRMIDYDERRSLQTSSRK